MRHLTGVSAKRFDWAQQYDTGATRDYFTPHFAIEGHEVEGAGNQTEKTKNQINI
jgi:hypothetical protein